MMVREVAIACLLLAGCSSPSPAPPPPPPDGQTSAHPARTGGDTSGEGEEANTIAPPPPEVMAGSGGMATPPSAVVHWSDRPTRGTHPRTGSSATGDRAGSYEGEGAAYRAAPGDGDFCEAVDAVVSAADCQRLSVQKAHLSTGIAAFDPPRTMTVGKPEDITLALGRAQSDEADNAGVGERIDDALGGHTDTQVRIGARIGRYMKATLTGSAFTIEALDDASKDLGASRFGTWQWRVTPLRDGPQRLLLTVQANAVDAGGNPTVLELASKQVAITVGVTSAQSRAAKAAAAKAAMDEGTGVLDSLKKLLIALGAVLLVVAGVYWKLRRSGSQPVGEDAPAKPPVK